MARKQLASDRVRCYPSDGTELRIRAKAKGGKTLPADIISELLKKK